MARTAVDNIGGLGTTVTDDPRQHILHYSRHGGPADVVRYIGSLLPEPKKSAWVEYRRKWIAADAMEEPFDFPLEVNLELTDHCNLTCGHCYQVTRTIPRKKVVRMDMVRKIVDECAGRGLGSLVLGCTDEALLHKQIVDVVEYSTRSGIPDVWLFTNGTLMTRELAAKFVALQPTRISISVDAHRPETYERIRGGKLSSVHRAIHSLLEERDRQGAKLPVIRLTFIRQPHNVHEIQDFVADWGGQVDQIDFQTLWDATWVESLPHTVWDEEFDCAQPWKQIMILANGDILPCCSEFARHMVVSNVNSTSIREAWFSEKQAEVRRSLKQRDYKRPCINCMGHRPKWEEAIARQHAAAKAIEPVSAEWRG